MLAFPSSTRDFHNSWRALVLLALFFAMAGCEADDGPPGDGPPDTGPVACPPGTTPVDGGCQEAGLPPGVTAGLPPDMPCPPGEAPLEGGGCQPAGVPPEACGQGFAPDGRAGCEPILPDDPCPPGQMAVPGDTRCHEVSPCGDGEYGTIPVEATSQFVNAAYIGADSDGTRARPWRRIQEGIDHAPPGAIVAVAAGRYTENLLIQSRPVRLWGRCPAVVEVLGVDRARPATVEVLYPSASRSEVRSLAITGPANGFATSGSSDVVLDRLWIHDTTREGVHIENSIGPTSVAVSDSLIEATSEVGVDVIGSTATIQATVVRDTQPLRGGTLGRGIHIQDDPFEGERSTLTLRSSLLERNHEAAVLAISSDATIESTVVRETESGADDGEDGTGIVITTDSGTKNRARAVIRASLVEQNRDTGVFVGGADATIEETVVRGTQSSRNGKRGYGIRVQSDPTSQEPAVVEVRASVVEQNHKFGVVVKGSQATIEATVVRDTHPKSDEEDGAGVIAYVDTDTRERASLTVRASLVEHNHYTGVVASQSDATIEETVVRDTQPYRGTMGRGISIQSASGARERVNATVRASLVEHNHDVGVFVSGSDATIASTVVRDTQPGRDGTSGRGIEVQDDRATSERANVSIRASLVEDNHEIGVFVGGSDATIEETIVRGTRPVADESSGRGITIQGHPLTHERSNVTLRSSLVDQNHNVGVIVMGADATIEGTVVRATRPNSDGRAGLGISIQYGGEVHNRAKATIRSSLVDQNHEAGVGIAASDVTIERTLVRGTQARRDGSYGDGVEVDSYGTPTTTTITSTTVETNARAGVASFSAAVLLVSSTVRCNKLDLNGREYIEGQPFTFDGSRDNVCGCDRPVSPCPVETDTLSPPKLLPPSQPLP